MKLLFDFFPVFLFFIAYKLADIYVATATAIAAGFFQVGYYGFVHRRVEAMHLITLGILVVFGGLTLWLQDRTFIMWKPSLINWLFALAFLGSALFTEKPLIQRMMETVIQIPPAIWRRLSHLWTAFFTVAGALNLAMAWRFFGADKALRAAASQTGDIDLNQCASHFSGQLLALCETAHQFEADWVNFKLFGLMGLMLLFAVLQAFYLARHIQEPDPDPANTPGEKG
ncbi:MAG: inner membrane-spanning protein YciB [Pseudomonadota bacterium]